MWLTIASVSTTLKSTFRLEAVVFLIAISNYGQELVIMSSYLYAYEYICTH